MDNGLSEYAHLIRYNRRKYPVIGQKSLTIRCASGCDRCRGTRRFLVQRSPGTLSRFASVASILGSADKVTDEPSTMTASGTKRLYRCRHRKSAMGRGVDVALLRSKGRV